MIKYLTGLVATLATLAVIGFVVINRGSYQSMIEWSPAIESPAPVVEPIVEPAVESAEEPTADPSPEEVEQTEPNN